MWEAEGKETAPGGPAGRSGLGGSPLDARMPGAAGKQGVCLAEKGRHVCPRAGC